MKKKYRNPIVITQEILTVCNEKQLISGITQKVQISYYVAKDQLDNLVEKGLVKHVYKKYLTTDKGKKLIREIENVTKMLGGKR